MARKMQFASSSLDMPTTAPHSCTSEILGKVVGREAWQEANSCGPKALWPLRICILFSYNSLLCEANSLARCNEQM